MDISDYHATLFFQKLKPSNNGCLEWTGYRVKGGYGRLTINRKCVLAHRVAWKIAYGSIPDGLDILHCCDNPACCNYEHLFIGNDFDNQRDSWGKGRHTKMPDNRGQRSGMSKLTENDILAIRSDARPQREIAKQFGIEQGHVSNIKRLKRWGHL